MFGLFRRRSFRSPEARVGELEKREKSRELTYRIDSINRRARFKARASSMTCRSKETSGGSRKFFLKGNDDHGNQADEITKIIRHGSKATGGSRYPEVGTVVRRRRIARVYGLDRVMSNELLEFPNGVFGLALNLEEESVGAVLLGESRLVKEGDLVKRTRRIMEVPAGPAMIGRVVDPLGEPLDGKGPIKTTPTWWSNGWLRASSTGA